jgi:hypothetical protein
MSPGAGLEREGSSEWEAIGLVRHRGEALVASGWDVDAGWRNPPDTGRPRVWKYGLYVLRSALCQGKNVQKLVCTRNPFQQLSDGGWDGKSGSERHVGTVRDSYFTTPESDAP